MTKANNSELEFLCKGLVLGLQRKRGSRLTHSPPILQLVALAWLMTPQEIPHPVYQRSSYDIHLSSAIADIQVRTSCFKLGRRASLNCIDLDGQVYSLDCFLKPWYLQF